MVKGVFQAKEESKKRTANIHSATISLHKSLSDKMLCLFFRSCAVGKLATLVVRTRYANVCDRDQSGAGPQPGNLGVKTWVCSSAKVVPYFLYSIASRIPPGRFDIQGEGREETREEKEEGRGKRGDRREERREIREERRNKREARRETREETQERREKREGVRGEKREE